MKINLKITIALMVFVVLYDSELIAQINFFSNTVTGTCASAIGRSNTSLGICSFFGGQNSKANGNYSFAFGSEAEATQDYSMALGSYIKASVQNSFVIGLGCDRHNLLNNNKMNSIAMGMNSRIPTFFISGAVGMDSTGRVAIGNCTEPAAKLHIKADVSEDASLLLESFNSHRSIIRLRDGRHTIWGDANFMGIETAHRLDMSSPHYRLLGSPDCGHLHFYGQSQPVIYFNAYRDSSGEYKDTDNATSFAFDFNRTGFYVRTSALVAEKGAITSWDTPMVISQGGHTTFNGLVGINIENYQADYALAVNGGIITTEVYIAEVENWPDHVFDEGYKLMGLRELETYVKTSKHLPDVPSEEEVLEKGYDIGTMQQILLKKVEELTLYAIELQKQIEAQQEIIKGLLDN